MVIISKAKFVSVIAYVSPDGVEKHSEVSVMVKLSLKKRGKWIRLWSHFYLPELDKTFAEITSEEKTQSVIEASH